MKRHSAKLNYQWRGHAKRKAPLDWDAEGKIIAWQESDDDPVKCAGDKWAWTWNETLQFIGQWSHTLPPEVVEYVKMEDIPVTFNESGYGSIPPGYGENLGKMVDRFGLKPLADVPPALRAFLQAVDEVARKEAWAKGEPDSFGYKAPYEGDIARAKASGWETEKQQLCIFLGNALFDLIRERNSEVLLQMGELVRLARDLPLNERERGNLPLRFAGNDLRGVIWRCYHILHGYLMNGPYYALPVKRTLREYVLQEWRLMGGKDANFDVEFRRKLKELGLAGLPEASSARTG